MPAPATHGPAQPGGGTVAVLGLGIMGAAMAARLAAGGWRVRGFDVDAQAAQRLAGQGVQPCADAAQAAASAFLCLVAVHDAGQVHEVLFGRRGAAGALPAGAIVWVASTISPQDAAACAARLGGAGLRMVDGPVSGGATGARDGELIVLAGADAATLADAAGPLQACARRVHHVGPVGAGSTVKLINNMLAASHIALAAEALALGERAGIDAHTLIEAVNEGSGASRMFEKRAPRMAAGDHQVHATVGTFLKDLQLGAAAARGWGQPAPMAAAALALFDRAAQRGYAGQSDTRLRDLYEALRGTD